MTHTDRRAILRAIANWFPSAPSVELLDSDRQALRDAVTIEIAPWIDLNTEDAMNQMQALRMMGATKS